MVWHRFETDSNWQQPSSHKLEGQEDKGEYDFHAFCLEFMDVIWAWVLAGGVIVALLLLY